VPLLSVGSFNNNTMPSNLNLQTRIESSPLYNPDLAPARAERRDWSTYNFAALWISMSVNILTYMLAGSLIQGGMNWKQAVMTIFVGNVIVLAPMLLNSHPEQNMGFHFRCWRALRSEFWVRTSPP
jgi:NCS1 family nucleobase:cation symporter-1